jgi:hypothetical protein
MTIFEFSCIFVKKMDSQTSNLKAIKYLIGLRNDKINRRVESTFAEVQKQQTAPRNVQTFLIQNKAQQNFTTNKESLAGNAYIDIYRLRCYASSWRFMGIIAAKSYV